MSGHKRAKYRAEHHGALAPQRDKPKLNVNEAERHLSLIGGSALVLCGLLRGSASGLVLAAVGGGLIYRGATGHCHVYEALDVSSTNNTDRDPNRLDHESGSYRAGLPLAT